MDVEEIRKYLTIDKLQLDDELSVQPTVYFEAAMKASQARSARDSAKIEIDVVKRDVAEEIRENEDKITETKLNRMLDADEDVIAAKKEYIRKAAYASEMEALSVSIAQRSHSLTSLSNLYGHNYFSRDGVGVRPNAEKSRLRRRST